MPNFMQCIVLILFVIGAVKIIVYGFSLMLKNPFDPDEW
jgi:hypothetical protein